MSYIVKRKYVFVLKIIHLKPSKTKNNVKTYYIV